MGGGGGNGPSPRELGQAITNQLAALRQAAPNVFSTEAEFQPQYADLTAQMLNDIMTGAPAGNYDVPSSTVETGFRKLGTGKFFPDNSAGRPRGDLRNPLFRKMTGFVPATRTIPGVRTLTREARPGLSAIATGGILPMLTEQAKREASMGGQLSPAQLRQAMQAIRTRRNGMLGGTGSAGEFGEALGLSAYGDQLQNQRRAFASQVAGQNMDVTNMGLSLIGGGGPRLMGNQFNAQDTWNTLLNRNAAKSNSEANNNAAMASGGLTAAALIASALV